MRFHIRTHVCTIPAAELMPITHRARFWSYHNVVRATRLFTTIQCHIFPSTREPVGLRDICVRLRIIQELFRDIHMFLRH